LKTTHCRKDTLEKKGQQKAFKINTHCSKWCRVDFDKVIKSAT